MSTPDDGFDQPTTTFGGSQFDGTGFSPEWSGQSTPTPPDELGDERDDNRQRGSVDFGLLVLRLALGVTMGLHGLQKIFGLFDGPGIGGFAEMLGGMGFTSQTTLLAWLTGIAELGGGVLLVLGLFTPLGAAAILGVAANIVYAKYVLGGRFFTGDGGGFEYELLLGLVAFALLFTGAGRASIDKNTPWRRKPVGFGIFGLLLAAAASVVVIILCR